MAPIAHPSHFPTWAANRRQVSPSILPIQWVLPYVDHGTPTDPRLLSAPSYFSSWVSEYYPNKREASLATEVPAFVVWSQLLPIKAKLSFQDHYVRSIVKGKTYFSLTYFLLHFRQKKDSNYFFLLDYIFQTFMMNNFKKCKFREKIILNPLDLSLIFNN